MIPTCSNLQMLNFQQKFEERLDEKNNELDRKNLELENKNRIISENQKKIDENIEEMQKVKGENEYLIQKVSNDVHVHVSYIFRCKSLHDSLSDGQRSRVV